MLTFQTLFYNILSVAIVDERPYYYYNDSIVINIIYSTYSIILQYISQRLSSNVIRAI